MLVSSLKTPEVWLLMRTRARERGAALADAIKTEKRLRPEAALFFWQAALLASVLAALAAYVLGQSDWRP